LTPVPGGVPALATVAARKTTTARRVDVFFTDVPFLKLFDF
jgi:hypothetical protein